MSPHIFVNFRRADTGTVGPHLDTALQREFGAQEVFRDQRSIAKGADFPVEIMRGLRKCDVLLAVIGSQWASLTDGNGRRFLDDPEDWVRKEIALALNWGITVLPVLVENAQLPDTADLPPDIAALVRRQCVNFRPHQEHIDLPPILEAVSEAVPQLRRRRQGPSSRGEAANYHVERIDRSSMVFGGNGQAQTFNGERP